MRWVSSGNILDLAAFVIHIFRHLTYSLAMSRVFASSLDGIPFTLSGYISAASPECPFRVASST